ncbi:MAG TPA: hypothetical protein ENJ31_00380, partial [Anaerolineae bacterium]|nr:hypothetical protein [Anaerolineae bacterium]
MKIAKQIVGILIFLTIIGGLVAAAPARTPSFTAYYTSAAVSLPDGSLWAAWSADTGNDGEIVASRWDGATWSPLEIVFPNPHHWDADPALAVDADGVVWLAWSSFTGAESALYLTHWLGRRWAEPTPLPFQATSPNRQPALAWGPDGRLWLAWVGFDGNDDEIYAAFWDGTAWSPPQRVGRDDDDPLAYDTHPRLAVDASGLPWLVWVSSQGLFDDAVLASRWDGASWSEEQPVSAPDDTPDVWPSLALDAEGQPWVAWQDVVGVGADARWRIQVAHRRAATGQWTGEEMVSSPATLPVDEQQPSLAFAADGKAHLAWTVEGRLSGVAYAAWDGAGWTQPAWAVAQNAAPASLLLADGQPRLVWAEADGQGDLSLHTTAIQRPLERLPSALPPQAAPAASEEQCIYNRYVAWGDSITWGGYDDPPDSGNPVGDYPGRLEAKLDTRVTPSEVINRGIPGEKVSGLRDRIGDEVAEYKPQFPLIMEGTNDVTHNRPPSAVAEDLAIIIDIVKKHSGIKGIRPWLATIIPRTDSEGGVSFYQATETMNEYIRSTAAMKGVPLADQWQAFLDYGDWVSLMWDSKHPNSQGMQLLADTWYARILGEYSWLKEEETPPTAWIASLPAQSECGAGNVAWTGQDNLTPVDQLVYDVQKNVNGGAWTDWRVNTTETGGSYTGDHFGDVLGFRVRARDLVGNLGDWSDPA